MNEVSRVERNGSNIQGRQGLPHLTRAVDGRD